MSLDVGSVQEIAQTSQIPAKTGSVVAKAVADGWPGALALPDRMIPSSHPSLRLIINDLPHRR